MKPSWDGLAIRRVEFFEHVRIPGTIIRTGTIDAERHGVLFVRSPSGDGIFLVAEGEAVHVPWSNIRSSACVPLREPKPEARRAVQK